MNAAKLFFLIVLLFVFSGICIGSVPATVWIYADGSEISFDIHAYNHSLVTEPNPDNCAATGEFRHLPFTIIGVVDTSSPLLHNLWRDAERVQVTIKLNMTDPNTLQRVPYYEIRLADAYISDISRQMRLSFLTQNNFYGYMERISFTYRGINHKWLPDEITAEAEWRSICEKDKPFNDFNFDGIVDFLDFELMADRWLDGTPTRRW